MVPIEFANILSLIQNMAVISSLYFSLCHIKSTKVDPETSVLNDLDEKIHKLVEIFVASPNLIRTICKEEPYIGSKLV